MPKLRVGISRQAIGTTASISPWARIRLWSIQFEFQPKSERVNMRLPKTLLDAVKVLESFARYVLPYSQRQSVLGARIASRS